MTIVDVYERMRLQEDAYKANPSDAVEPSWELAKEMLIEAMIEDSSVEEKKVINLYRGLRESMKTPIIHIMEATQK